MYLLLMYALNPEADARLRRPSLLRLLVLLVLISLALLLAEPSRAESALQQWKAEKAAKGEIFEATKLWPAISPESVAFSNRLNQVLKQFPRTFWNYGGQIESIVRDTPGQWRRGSQEPEPVFWYNGQATNTWENFQPIMASAEPALESLRQLMRNPPAGVDYSIVEKLSAGSLPNLVNVRLGAQALGGAAIFELHHGNLNGALDNLTALHGFIKLHADDPSLIAFMIRMAIVGLSVDIDWDALQADGWTEPQLARLQQSCADTKGLLAQMPRALEACAAERIAEMEWLRSHTLREFLERVGAQAEKFGYKKPTEPAWRHWVFHPAWSAAWADEEELEYLRQMELELAVLREAQQYKSLKRVSSQITAIQDGYRAPTNARHFYGKLPGDDMFQPITPGKTTVQPEYPYGDFRRAWAATMQNITLHEMVITAIALKRYELKHGKRAGTLADLVPEFLAAAPRDYMDGQPLRYRANPDGNFALYSVGSDFKDDNGDPRPILEQKTPQGRTPWNATDWVWPHAVAGDDAAKVTRTSLRN